MAKDRVEICESYVCANSPCEKGREANHSGYCQRCDKYKPRAHIKHPNMKKAKLEKIRKSEKYDD